MIAKLGKIQIGKHLYANDWENTLGEIDPLYKRDIYYIGLIPLYKGGIYINWSQYDCCVQIFHIFKEEYNMFFPNGLKVKSLEEGMDKIDWFLTKLGKLKAFL